MTFNDETDEDFSGAYMGLGGNRRAGKPRLTEDELRQRRGQAEKASPKEARER